MRKIPFISQLLASIVSLPRPSKRLIQILFDCVALMLAVWCSYVLRLGTGFVPNASQMLLIVIAPMVTVPVFVRMGLYRAIMRYLPDRAFWTILQAVTLGTLFWVLVVFLAELYGATGMPRSIPVIYWFVALAFTGGSRFLVRHMLSDPGESYLSGKTLIYGAGSAGSQLVAALRAGGDRSVAGFLDDNRSLMGQDVAGLRVFSPHSLPSLIETLGIEEVILCVPSASATRKLEIAAWLAQYRVKQRILPSISELAAGKYQVSRLKEIDIEDLLGRTRVNPDPELLSQAVQGKSVLITGAGGSIGSELSRMVAKNGPREIILVDASEAALYDINRHIRAEHPSLSRHPVLTNIADKEKVGALFARHQPDVVFHAAAYKHVPMLEVNPAEGVLNNVFGSYYLTRAAFEAGVATFVLISTDKAVWPSSVMGATKRWAELITRHFAKKAAQTGSGQRFLAVRFGNVLGSRGSVVPLFKEQIAKGGPVTVTDERMTRYFMAIPEAAELIVQSSALAKGGETFLLDMGEPVRIMTLAENMIRLAGLTVRSDANPKGDIEIVVTGMRKGEKLEEVLDHAQGDLEMTVHPKIRMVTTGEQREVNIDAALEKLRAALSKADHEELKQVLFAFAEAKQVEPFGVAESETAPLKKSMRLH